ncbi:MAG: ParB/RepB/Spo0J family partition protein [Candidatus Rokubacteria bacterium]|nr:ParB/RepB/Spo0J family partition protein [Candidatus Rokubacteria bacterium]
MTTTAPVFQLVPLAQLHESPLNPRKHFDPKSLEELTASITASGIITPLVVRPNAGGFEIAAGHRRYRAAQKAGLTEAPCVVRPMTEAEFVEILSIENGRREDLTPLEEAEGYRLLMTKAGYSVERIAERIGMSVKYVYDRVKLLQLAPAAQTLLRDGTITAGHAILLARLTPKDQARVIGDPKDVERGGLLKYESLLWDPEEQGRPKELERVKPVSVRELEAWIDEHVRFDAAKADPMLFAETVGTVTAAKETAEKIVPITHQPYIDPEAREGRTFGPRSWKRADGKKGSKPCEHAVTGVIAVGPGRGEAFKVCIDKDKCATHWGAEKRARARQAARGEMGGSQTGAQDRWEREQAKRQEEQERKEAERARWTKAEPVILQALAAAVKKAPTKARGLLASIVLEHCQDRGYGAKRHDAGDYVPRGTTAEDVLRHAAFTLLAIELRTWQAPEEFPRRAKAFGLDVRKLVDQVAPVPKAKPDSAAPTSAPKKTKKRKQ